MIFKSDEDKDKAYNKIANIYACISDIAFKPNLIVDTIKNYVESEEFKSYVIEDDSDDCIIYSVDEEIMDGAKAYQHHTNLYLDDFFNIILSKNCVKNLLVIDNSDDGIYIPKIKDELLNKFEIAKDIQRVDKRKFTADIIIEVDKHYNYEVTKNVITNYKTFDMDLYGSLHHIDELWDKIHKIAEFDMIRSLVILDETVEEGIVNFSINDKVSIINHTDRNTFDTSEDLMRCDFAIHITKDHKYNIIKNRLTGEFCELQYFNIDRIETVDADKFNVDVNDKDIVVSSSTKSIHSFNRLGEINNTLKKDWKLNLNVLEAKHLMNRLKYAIQNVEQNK